LRYLAIGDIHGYYSGLLQALDRANYDPLNDKLIQIGDLTDGFDSCVEVIEFFMTTEHKVMLRGNHDEYARQYFAEPSHINREYWEKLGGKSTIIEFERKGIVPGTEKFAQILQFLTEQQLTYLHDDRLLCVHAGLGSHQNVYSVDDDSLLYLDRSMWQNALYYNQFLPNDYEAIFIGHTALFKLNEKHPASADASPVKRGNIWNLDTGAGWGGRVTVMDIERINYWQSDFGPYSPR